MFLSISLSLTPQTLDVAKELRRQVAMELIRRQKAASLIQAACRGYLARKSVRHLRYRNNCAVLIQASFRGFSARRRLRKRTKRM